MVNDLLYSKMSFSFCHIYFIAKISILTIQLLFNTIFSFYKFSTNNYFALSTTDNIFYLVKNVTISPSKYDCTQFIGNYSTIFSKEISFDKIAVVAQYWLYFLILFPYSLIKLIRLCRGNADKENEPYDVDDRRNAKIVKYLSFDLIFQFFCCSSLFLISGNDYSKPCISNISQVPYDIARFLVKFTLIVFIICILAALFLQYVLKCDLTKCCSCIKIKLFILIASFITIPFMMIIFVLRKIKLLEN